MVGGFSAILPLQSHAGDDLRLSILPTLAIMLVMCTVFACPVSATVSPAAHLPGTNDIISRNIHKSSLDGPRSGLPKLHDRPTTTPTTHLRRHFLAGGAGAHAGKVSRIAEQATRALVGSSPPKCIKKCGACTPCRSVLVPIHTNNIPASPAEYYPEAWRCQCKGKIYNP